VHSNGVQSATSGRWRNDVNITEYIVAADTHRPFAVGQRMPAGWLKDCSQHMDWTDPNESTQLHDTFIGRGVNIIYILREVSISDVASYN